MGHDAWQFRQGQPSRPTQTPKAGSRAVWIFRGDRSKKEQPFLPGSQSPAFSELKEATAICGLILPV